MQSGFILQGITPLATQTPTLVNGGTTVLASGVMLLTVIPTNATLLASQSFALPSNPIDGQAVVIVSRAVISAITFTGGVVDSTVPAGVIGGSRLWLVFSSKSGKWG